jgi:hypothetical protein
MIILAENSILYTYEQTASPRLITKIHRGSLLKYNFSILWVYTWHIDRGALNFYVTRQRSQISHLATIFHS